MSSSARTQPTLSDVRWAYRYFLGREAESDAVTINQAESSIDNDMLRHRFLASPEAGAKSTTNAIPVLPQGAFCHFKPGAPKVLVLGNCQAPNIARIIANISEASVFGFELVDLPRFRETIGYELEDVDFILTAYLKESWGPIGTDHLKKKYGKKVASYVPLYFNGLHPDAYIPGTPANRILGPASIYHSKIVTSSYLEGLDANACVELFNRDTYEARGYFQATHAAFEEIARRERSCDIRLEPWLKASMYTKHLMYTLNHPTTDVLLKFATGALSLFGLPYMALPHQMLYNSLFNDVMWPIYPPIAHFHGLDFQTKMLFWRAGVALELTDFVHRCYLNYNLMSPERQRALKA